MNISADVMSQNRTSPSWKSRLSQWLPPVILLRYRRWRTKFRWEGPFSSWEDASAHATGYSDPRILERLLESARAVSTGAATYERDGVLFHRTEYSWPVVAGLMKAAATDRKALSVMDIGGSLGTSYVQNRRFLEDYKRLRWSVVEQPHIAQAGKAEFEDGRLHFYDSIEACLKKERPNVVLLSSVLSYLADPYALIRRIQEFGPAWIIVDLTLVHDGDKDKVMVQHVAKSIYEASYPCWLFSYDALDSALRRSYTLVEAFEPFTDPVFSFGVQSLRFQGFILRRSSR